MSLSPSQNELGDMLRYKRPADSAAERAFKEKFLTPLGVQWDSIGNGYLQIERAPIIWSSHTDTVHWTSGRQDVTMRSAQGGRHIAFSSDSDCLGADCTTGVFIMMNMIRSKVPGMYIFHSSEEKGCIGSKFIAKHHEKTLRTYKAAIAFDRRGYTDIVEYQHGSRCCSGMFAKSLAGILGRNYAPSSGVYTDTAEYTDLIGECTNISVGYFNQHTASETQDVDFALWLAERMCTVDFSGLTYSRKPGEIEDEYPARGYNGYRSGSYRYSGYQTEKATTMYGLVSQNPWCIAKMLEAMDLTTEEVASYCDTYYLPTTHKVRKVK